MPRISAPTVAENRHQRQAALLAAGSALLQRHGAFTVAQVATEVGLSRSAVYEYYPGTAELVTDVLDRAWADCTRAASRAVAGQPDPQGRLRAWVHAALGPESAHRRALVRAAGATEVPHSFLAVLGGVLADLGCPDPEAVGRLVTGATDAALDRRAADVAPGEAADPLVVEFVVGGTERLVDVSRAGPRPTPR